jgi:hypothetical protein
MSRLLAIAPLLTWVRVVSAAALMTAGLVGLAHVYIAVRGLRAPLVSPLGDTALMSPLRLTLTCFILGAGATSWQLLPVGAWLPAACAVVAAGLLACEIAVRTRRRHKPKVPLFGEVPEAPATSSSSFSEQHGELPVR